MTDTPNEPVFDAFSQMRPAWRVANKMKDDAVAWYLEYIAAYERQQGLDPRTLEMPYFDVRHAAIVRSEEQLPAVIFWLANESAPRFDTEGTARADLGVGVLLVAEAHDEDLTGELLHHYVAITKQLLLDLPPGGGLANTLEMTDGDYRGIDAPTRGVTMLGADLSYLAKNVITGKRGSKIPPGATPREDPYETWPDANTVETTHLEIDPTTDPEA